MLITENNEDFELQRARKVFSRISVRLLVFVGFCLLIIAVMLAVMISDEETATEDLESILILTSFFTFIPLLFWIWLKFRRAKASFFPLLNSDRFSPRDLLLVIPLILFTIGLFSTLLYLVSLADMDLFNRIQGWLDSDLLVITEESSLTSVLGIIILVGVLGPFFEEVVFRGLMVERLGAKYGYSGAVIFSSISFGFLHIDFVGAALFGFAMCLLYLQSGSLLAPILIHMLNNLTAILMSYVSFQMDWQELDNAEFYQQYSWFWILILVISVIWLVRYITRNWNIVYTKEPVPLKSGRSPGLEQGQYDES